MEIVIFIRWENQKKSFNFNNPRNVMVSHDDEPGVETEIQDKSIPFGLIDWPMRWRVKGYFQTF